jgi:DNA-binding GntR family transcriptional regulator
MIAVSAAYQELASRLAERIRTAELTSRVPSENELAADHGVSRLTARAALRELEQWHLVRRVRGAGTFVAPRLDYTISTDLPPSWHEAVRAMRRRPRAEVLEAAPAEPPVEVADDLGLAAGTPVLRLVRRGFVDDLVATVGTSHLPADLLPEGHERLTTGGSLFGVLRSEGFEPVRAWCRAELEPLPIEVARLLGHEGRPLTWRVHSLNRCARTGRLLERSDTWMRADVFRVRFHLEGRLP